MLDWLYIHIGLGRKGAFLFGFMSAVMLILVFVGLLIMLWCKECLRASEFLGVAKKRKGGHLEGITKVEEKSFSGVVQAVCLFRLLFVSMVWAGWSFGWFAVLTAYYRWWSWLFYVFMWAGLACCGFALLSGVLMLALSKTRAWKDGKDELYRLVDETLVLKHPENG